jgi:hypothetical protein
METKDMKGTARRISCSFSGYKMINSKFSITILLIFNYITIICYGQSNGIENSAGKNISDSSIQIDWTQKVIKIPCVVTLSDGIVEWVLSYKGFRSYESFLQTTVNPLDLQLALIGLGYRQLSAGEISDSVLYTMIRDEKPRLKQLKLFLTWNDSAGFHTRPLEYFFKVSKSGTKPENISWYFNGFDKRINRSMARQVPMVSKTHRNITCSVVEINSLYTFDYYSIVIDKKVSPVPGTKATLLVQKFSKTNNY